MKQRKLEPEPLCGPGGAKETSGYLRVLTQGCETSSGTGNASGGSSVGNPSVTPNTGTVPDWLKKAYPNDYDCTCKRCPHCGGKMPNTPFYPQPAPWYPYPNYTYQSNPTVTNCGGGAEEEAARRLPVVKDSIFIKCPS